MKIGFDAEKYIIEQSNTFWNTLTIKIVSGFTLNLVVSLYTISML